MVTTSIDRPNSIDNSRQLSIARNFVLQYYTFLNKAPHLAHRFYSHDSTLIHGTLEKPGEKKTDPCVGLDKIKEKIDDLELNDCRVKIKQIDSLETLGRGLVIQVIGELSNNGAPMRRFLQTFVLAPGPDEISRQNNRNNNNDATATSSVTHTTTSTNVNNEHHQQHHQQQHQQQHQHQQHHHHHHHQHHHQQQHQQHNQQQQQQQQHNHSYQTNASAPSSGTGSLTSDHSNEKYYVLNNIFRYQDDGIDDDEISSSNINTSLDNPNHISSSSSTVPATISNSNAPTTAPNSGAPNSGAPTSAPTNAPASATATIAPTSNTSTNAASTPLTTSTAAATVATTTTTSSSATSATTTTTSNAQTTPTTSNAPTNNTTSVAPTTTTTSHTPTATTTTNTPTTTATTTTSISSTTTTTSYALSDQAPSLKKDVHNTNSSSEPKTWANMVSKQTPRGQNRQNRDGPTTPALNPDGGDFRMKEKYPDENQVFVGGLTPEISEDDLRESFKSFGSIQAVRLSKGNYSKSGKPTPDFGFIIFDNPAIVQNILQRKFMIVKNQKLNLEPKRSLAKSGYNNFGRGSKPSSYASRGSREHKASNHQQQQPPLPAPSAQQQSNQPQQSHQPQPHIQDQLPQHQQSQQQNQHKHQHHQPQQQQTSRSHKNAPAI